MGGLWHCLNHITCINQPFWYLWQPVAGKMDRLLFCHCHRSETGDLRSLVLFPRKWSTNGWIPMSQGKQPCYIAVFFSISTDLWVDWRPNNPWILNGYPYFVGWPWVSHTQKARRRTHNNGHFWYVTAGSKLMFFPKKRWPPRIRRDLGASRSHPKWGQVWPLFMFGPKRSRRSSTNTVLPTMPD